jgi:hypothetical protein
LAPKWLGAGKGRRLGLGWASPLEGGLVRGLALVLACLKGTVWAPLSAQRWGALWAAVKGLASARVLGACSASALALLKGMGLARTLELLLVTALAKQMEPGLA